LHHHLNGVIAKSLPPTIELSRERRGARSSGGPVIRVDTCDRGSATIVCATVSPMRTSSPVVLTYTPLRTVPLSSSTRALSSCTG
jgi:hypothetical protein